MTRFLTTTELIQLYQQLMQRSGGAIGIRDLGGLQSAVAQPRATFDGQELYPSLADKAAALAYSLIQNHPFIDGNKRIGHAAMELFLLVNGFEISADSNEQEQVILSLAASTLSREAFQAWVVQHIQPRS